jgi:uncharacterized membrane protein YbhN (UPF0104 family)
MTIDHDLERGLESTEHRISPTAWARARVFGGVAILAFVVWRLGTGPIVDGLRAVSLWSLAAGAGIGVITTMCCAWRWTIVARGLGVGLPLRTAIVSYYRSQFLNTTLPGGILGDVHRAVRHGREAGDVGRSLRAVGWERVAGQVVQGVLTLVVLLAVHSKVQPSLRVAVTIVAVATAAVLVVASTNPPRWKHAIGRDIRQGLLADHAWQGIVLASTIAVTGYAATFLVAARTAGVDAPVHELLPLALLVLLAMAVPLNIGGWGPREGVAAWLFGAAGVGASQGVATATVYGVMAVVAALPGAGVLIVDWMHRHAEGVGHG